MTDRRLRADGRVWGGLGIIVGIRFSRHTLFGQTQSLREQTIGGGLNPLTPIRFG